MCCTSIFYFLNLLGYVNFEKTTDFIIDPDKLMVAAQCQRYYCLGHAAFVSGLLIAMKYPKRRKYIFDEANLADILFYVALVTFPLYLIFDNVAGLSQFSNQFSFLSFIAGTLALAFAIPQKKIWNTSICIILYCSNFYSALVSGYKEPIILSVMVLGIFLYEDYKKLVLAVFVPSLLILFLLLPTYARIFRENNWDNNVAQDQATQLALDAAITQNSGDDFSDTNWNFLVSRFSEIEMFTKFVISTPDKIDYYNLDIIYQSFISVTPRIFWPDKPVTEAMVMERVYNAGVVYRGSQVSAKPAYIVDAYLSDGPFGVWVALFIYGMAAQLISQKAEVLFGGYLLGTALIFSGLFQILWRGLSFEFLLNNVFWGYITMLVIHRLFRALNILQPV